MATHRCPYCRFQFVHRSRRRGFREKVLLRALSLRPYRCGACGRRHYGFAFLRKNPRAGVYRSPWASLVYAVPHPAPLAAVFLAVVLVVGTTSSQLMSFGLGNLAGNSAGDSNAAPTVNATGTFASGSGIAPVRVAAPGAAPRQEAHPLPSEPIYMAQAVPAQASAPGAPQEGALGSVRATGEVILNGTAVPQVATFFPGDTLRTGSNGNAVLEFPGKGTITVSPQSLMRFTKSTRYVAELNYGRVTSQSLRGTTSFQTRVGNFVVVPDPERPEMTAEIVRALDGLIRIKAVQGSVGIIELEGAQTTFIRDGGEATISPDGRLSAASTAQAPATPSPTTLGGGGGGGHTALIGLGVGAAAAAGLGIALASSGNDSNPVSPSAP
ncbi:MAG: hypothetical protein ACE145_03330 [Terriglobia bacterium]